MEPMGWMAMLAGIQTILGIGQQRSMMNLAQSVVEEGQYWRDVGVQKMTGAIKRRQHAYDSIWKLVYGGVENADYQSLLNLEDAFQLGDRYYYDDEGKMQRKDSIGPGDVEEAPTAGGVTEKTIAERKKITLQGGPHRGGGLSNPAVGSTLSNPSTTITHSRGTSISGGSTKSGVSISKRRR